MAAVAVLTGHRSHPSRAIPAAAAAYGAPVPPQFRRYLPLILVAFLLVILLPSLLRKKTAAGPSTSTRDALTVEAMNLIDKGEQAYMTANGRFTPHLADLLTIRLADDLAIGLTVELDVGRNGQRYLAQVRSDVLSLVRGRENSKLIAQSCLVLTSSSGASCPLPAK
jgi:hypothetical protein